MSNTGTNTWRLNAPPSNRDSAFEESFYSKDSEQYVQQRRAHHHGLGQFFCLFLILLFLMAILGMIGYLVYENNRRDSHFWKNNTGNHLFDTTGRGPKPFSPRAHFRKKMAFNPCNTSSNSPCKCTFIYMRVVCERADTCTGMSVLGHTCTF